MKRFLALIVLVMFVFALGCEKLQSPTAPTPQESQQQALSFDKKAVDAAQAKLQALSAGLQDMLKQRQKANLSKSAAAAPAAASGKITVPDDYPTIQQAVDAATPGTKIKVKAGVYTEVVVIDVPEVRVTAEGAVTVKGGFAITADKVMLDEFANIEPMSNIVLGFNVGILVSGQSTASPVHEVEIKDNKVTGGDVGIGLLYASNCTVKGNKTADATTIGGFALQDADGNVLEGNVSRGAFVGIFFSFGCDNNQIRGNKCNDNAVGILLRGTGNHLSNNACNNNTLFGIVVVDASDNTIGSGNTGNNNGLEGLHLEPDAVNNVVKRNTFLGNTNFDINNLGSGNTFISNKANTTNGV
ncbi:MAG: right-handed parallel beta-helix repeat-containing protein [candidate division KSB1 bacterium]|nr:right-handed parallel beta-helix repeat-containing protein [candidate division KSB1 bacterium]